MACEELAATDLCEAMDLWDHARRGQLSLGAAYEATSGAY
jgi:hypothetical protein